jgi:hypothetical protein
MKFISTTTSVAMAAVTAIVSTLLLTFFVYSAHAETNDADTNADSFISVAEGVPFYGGIEVSLTTAGDTGSDSALALDRYPTATADGDYSYVRVLTLENDTVNDLANGHIVVHGIDINNSGAYDGEKESSIAEGVPFEATVPAACGVITQIDGTSTYSANLNELNSTGVTGAVVMTVNGNDVTVAMTVSDSAPNLPHAQHIHVGGQGVCPPNTTGAATDETGENNETEVDVEVSIENVRDQINTNRADIQAEIDRQRDEIESEIESARSEVRGRINDIRAELSSRF